MAVVLVELNHRWRVVHDPLQWILQRAGKARSWENVRYHRERKPLVEISIKELIGYAHCRRDALATIAAWPRHFVDFRLP